MNLFATIKNITTSVKTAKEFWSSDLMGDIKSAVIYGNTCTYPANEVGRKNHEWGRKNFEGTYDKSIYEKFWRDGYLLAGQLFDEDLIIKTRDEYLAALKNDALSDNGFDDPTIRAGHNYGGYDGPIQGFRRDILDVARAMPTALLLAEDPRLKRLLTDIYGSDFMIANICSWRIYHVPKAVSDKFEATTNRLHFDDQMSDAVKVFVYLNDVSEEHGPFQFFSRPYSRNLLWGGFKKDLRSSSLVGGLSPKLLENRNMIKHVGPMGSVALCATPYCLHRAGETALGCSRDLLQFTFRPCVDGEMLSL